MVPDFVHVGFTAATPLLNQGFPARFLDVIDALYDHYFVSPAKTQRAKDAMNDKRNEAGLQPI